LGSIQEFYIIASGTCIYAKSTQVKVDKQLIAGFLAALDSFSLQVASNHIQNFAMGNSNFYIITDQNLQFVARTPVNTKEKAVLKDLAKMKDIFFKHFPPELFSQSWESNVELFSSLDKAYAEFMM
jgi:hypothetical protein